MLILVLVFSFNTSLSCCKLSLSKLQIAYGGVWSATPHTSNNVHCNTVHLVLPVCHCFCSYCRTPYTESDSFPLRRLSCFNNFSVSETLLLGSGTIGDGRGGKGDVWNKFGQIWNYSGHKFDGDHFFKDHNNPTTKKVENFGEDFFYLFGETLYIWKYFVFNIRADSSSPPKLFCSPTAMSGTITSHAYMHDINEQLTLPADEVFRIFDCIPFYVTTTRSTRNRKVGNSPYPLCCLSRPEIYRTKSVLCYSKFSSTKLHSAYCAYIKPYY